MTQLVAIPHPLTGKVLRMHPALAAQQHRWVHPDPTVPTPASSLPLFELAALDRVLMALSAAHAPAAPDLHHAAHPAGVLEGVADGR